MKNLFLILARGGSKRLPGKNIKLLGGKPLIRYTIEAALGAKTDEDIVCLSTDSKAIAAHGLDIEIIMRPEELASDAATSEDAIRHAIDEFGQRGQVFDAIILLQPTSPFRNASHIKSAIKLYSEDIDMVVSVTKAHAGFEKKFLREDKNGCLRSLVDQKLSTPINAFEINGAIYIINPKSLKQSDLPSFSKRIKFEMEPIAAVDIDYLRDFEYCEFLMQSGYVL